MSAYDDITEALAAAGCAQKGHDWTCPVHKGGQERSPSLSVNEGDKGVVMKCQAGCENADVLRAIGKKASDMFDEKLTLVKKEIVATYNYTDADGKLLYQVVRYEPKEFRQRRPTEMGGWEWSVKGVERVPYHLPQLVEAVSEGRVVYVVEGEKDVEAIERAGGVATCNSGGAGKWADEFAQYFKGATVRIVRDKDEAGHKHAEQVKINLRSVTSDVVVLEPASGKDVADHLKAGLSLDSLSFVTDEMTVVENPLRLRVLTIDEIDDIPPPEYLIQDMIVTDSTAVMFGQPGSAKSFVAMDWALSIAHGLNSWMSKRVSAGPVIYVVAEGLSGYGIRKKDWRKEHPVHTAGDLLWVRDRINLLDATEAQQLIDLCDEEQPVLVVIDTLAKCMPGADENAPAPMSQAIDVMDSIRSTTKACVLAVHHTPKDGSTPRGHSSLSGAVSSAIQVKKDEGIVSLTVTKQKDGPEIDMRLRLEAFEQSAVLRPMGDGPIIVSNSAMNERAVKEGLKLMVVHGGASISDLMEATDLSRATIFRVLKPMIENGFVGQQGRRYILL